MKRREAEDAERAELYMAILVVAELNTWGHNLKEEIRTMLQAMDFETLMQSAICSEMFEKGVAQGIMTGTQKGMERGLKKGMATGLKNGMANGMEKGRKGRYLHEDALFTYAPPPARMTPRHRLSSG